MPLYGTVLIPGANPIVNGTTGKFLYDDNGVLGETDAPSTVPGGSDTNIQFNDSGAFGGSDQFVYDKASAVTLQTLTDADTADAVLTLGVHANEGDAHSASIILRGSAGSDIPRFELVNRSTVLRLEDGGFTARSTFFLVDNPTEAAGQGVEVGFSTTGDGSDGNALWRLRVHNDGANQADFNISVDGASGNNTPDTAFTFPGAALFVGATGYSFDNTITFASAQLPATTTTFTNGAGANVGTLTNAPATGNPTKWLLIDDNGTTRKIPSW